MNRIGLWQINDTVPARLTPTGISAERNLEDWIEHDPSLLEQGLVIVGRQIRLEGGPVDLLALDPQGRFVLIEIKRERLRREVIAQAIDYASCLYRHDSTRLQEQCDKYLRSKASPHALSELLATRGQTLDDETSNREIVIYLVGTSIDSGLERMVEYLAERAELSVRLVTLSTFHGADSKMLLAREIHESIVEPTSLPSTGQRKSKPRPTIEAALAMADENGLSSVIRPLYNTAIELGLQAMPFSRSIMFAPAENKTRCLFVISTEKRSREQGAAASYIAGEAFEQFYGIDQPTLVAATQLPTGEILLDQAKAEKLRRGLETLFRRDE